MDQRISLVTLGVADLARSRAFYEALGWRTGAQPADDVAFFQAGPMIFALWDRERMVENNGLTPGEGFGGVELAQNVRSPAEVDAVVEQAREAGAKVVCEPAETFWGGYSAIFLDPDGHAWEIAHNPHWTLDADGKVSLGA